MSLSLAEKIAHLALDTFAALPAKCKPRTLPDGRREWTVISAVVISQPQSQPHPPPSNALRTATYSIGFERQNESNTTATISRNGTTEENDDVDIKIVSLATGTKSIPVSVLPKCNGLILHDCHAEILALRGFNYWLLREMQSVLQMDCVDSSPWLEVLLTIATSKTVHAVSSTRPSFPFKLRDGVEVSLFTTEAPCGDASVELLMMAQEAAGKDITPWPDGPVEAEEADRLPPGRGGFSNLGALRRKPARADAEISMSKSCSDKLMLKQVTGLLSFPVDSLLEPSGSAFLRRIIVHDEQWNAEGYRRAFGEDGRLRKVLSAVEQSADCHPRFFEVDVLQSGFKNSGFEKGSLGGNGGKNRASNISAVWIAGTGTEERNTSTNTDVVEVLLNGVKQGFRQFDDRDRKGSLLCRRNMLREAGKVRVLLGERNHAASVEGASIDTETTYSQTKSSPGRAERTRLKQMILDGLGGWPSRSREDDFQVSPLLLSS